MMKKRWMILFAALVLLAPALYGCAGCDDENGEDVIPPTCETNLPPVALISTPFVENVVAGQDVVLDGGRSYDEDLCPDPNGVIQLYHWELMSVAPTDAVDVASFVFSNNDTISARTIFFRAPERRSTLMVQLTVFDGELWSEPVSASINMYNAPPVAEIDTSEGSLVVSGTTQVLTGSGSDVDGDPITYHWTQTDGPEISFDDPTSRTPTIDVPYNFGERFTVSLIVNDGMVDSIPATASFQIFRRDRDHTLFVRSDGDDTYNSGRQSSPLRTVTRALELAEAITGAVDVVIADGIYNEDRLILPPNTSIFGGFSTSNWKRDISVYESEIKQTNDTDDAGVNIYCTGGTFPESLLIINGQLGDFSETMIDGLVFKGRTDCEYILVKGFDQSTIWVIGGADPEISNNKIYSGFPDTGFVDYLYTIGINVGGSDVEHTNVNEPLIYNNVIFGGQGDFQTYGVVVAGKSRPKIYNNTILSGQVRQVGGGNLNEPHGRSIGILLNNNSTDRVVNADIVNNLIYLNLGSLPELEYRFGVMFLSDSAPFDIDRFKNNSIFIPNNIAPELTAYYIYGDSQPSAYALVVNSLTWLTTIAEVNALGGSNCIDNFDYDPYLLGFDSDSPDFPDYHIPSTSPVVDIGLDLSDEVPFDFDGEARGNDGNGDSIAGYDLGYDEVVP
jgi:Protein of unknown function (DUF1565)